MMVCILYAVHVNASEPALTGLHFIGYPSASYKDGEGFSGGLSLMFYQYGNGEMSPYHWNVNLETEASTEGKKEMALFWDQINLLGDRSRFTLNTGYRRYLADDYLGLGNRNQYREQYVNPDHPGFIDEQFYTYKRDLRFLLADIQWPAPWPDTRFLSGFGLKSVTVPAVRHESRLELDQPAGIDGGLTAFLRTGIVFDTRDDEAAPGSGVWSECLFETAHWIWASDYMYSRLTLTDRRYKTILPRLVFARRLLLEVMPGDPPFYEMTTLAGSFELHHGLGGATSLRGVPRFMFAGPHKWLMNFEFRAELFSMTVLYQPFTFYIQPFFDCGRVWQKLSLDLTDLHAAYGCSFNIRWKKDAIYSLSLGRSRYSDLAVYMTVGNLF